MTPSERTIRYLFDRGIIAGRVDRKVSRLVELDWPGKDPESGESKGIFDILAIPDDGPVLIQVTGGGGGNHANRVQKVLGQPQIVRQCLKIGMKCAVWSWKPDEDEPRVTPITLQML